MLSDDFQSFNESVSSISTKTGDDGTTSLLFGRRVPKTDLRVAANGRVDDLNARLGMAKACLAAGEDEARALIARVQRSLIALMGEVAVVPEDWERYEASALEKFDGALLAALDERVERLESAGFSFDGWATPGNCFSSAAMECARTACREAEVALLRVRDEGLLNPRRGGMLLQSLNRLSDVLWLEARRIENAGVPQKA